MSAAVQVLAGLALPWMLAGGSFICCRIIRRGWRGLGPELIIFGVAVAIAFAVTPAPPTSWGAVAGAGVTAVIGAAILWWQRRKRRPVAAVIGEKSRAIRDALVRRARGAARPRPALRPVPVGAGW